MAEDKPDDQGVKDWLARRLGENLPPRPRPTGPRPARRPDPPLTAPSTKTARRAIPSTLVPRGETPRPAPINVGPRPRRVTLTEAGFVVPEGRGTESEDTGELLFDDTAPSRRKDELAGSFVDHPGPDEEPTRESSPLRVRAPTSAVPEAWNPEETGEHDLYPVPTRSATPPTPDAFTADGRFVSHDGLPEPTQDPFPPPEPYPSSGPFRGADPLDSDPFDDDDGLDSPDPVTRRIPPTEDEDRLTGELDVHLIPIESAGPYPTPTMEHSSAASLPVGMHAAVIEVSETGRVLPQSAEPTGPMASQLASQMAAQSARSPVPPAPRPEAAPSREAWADAELRAPDGPVPTAPDEPGYPMLDDLPHAALETLQGFEQPLPSDSFLFTNPEPDTVVLLDEMPQARGFSTTIWIVAGVTIGVVGFTIALAALIVWLWLLGR